jgi:hypothetical protein
MPPQEELTGARSDMRLPVRRSPRRDEAPEPAAATGRGETAPAGSGPQPIAPSLPYVPSSKTGRQFDDLKGSPAAPPSMLQTPPWRSPIVRPGLPDGPLKPRPRQWSHLSEVPIEDWFSRGLRKSTEDINKRVRALLSARACLDAQDAPEVLDMATVDLASLRCRRDDELEHFLLLQTELVLRRDWGTLDDQRRVEMHGELDKRFEAHVEAQTEARAALVKLGYHDVELTIQDPSKILPIFIMAHPKVFAALGHKDELFARIHDRSQAQANAQALAATEKRLNELRVQLLGR